MQTSSASPEVKGVNLLMVRDLLELLLACKVKRKLCGQILF